MSGLLTAQQISAVAIELLARRLVLPATCTIIPGAEFAGRNGDTITVAVPQPSNARTQTTPGADITFDDIDEIAVNVKLAHLYHGKLVTDEELSLKIEDFARQITRIQVEAVARGAEDQVAAAMDALAADAEFAFAADPDDTVAKILGAREFLTDNGAPPDDRFLASSPQIVTRLLTVPQFVKANEAGTTDALRNATVGSIYGLTVVETPGIADGTAVAYHRSGFCFANRVPVTPRGAVDSAQAAVGPIGLRQIFQYVPTKLSDASVVSTFAGAAAVYEDGDASTPSDNRRFYKLDTGASS